MNSAARSVLRKSLAYVPSRGMADAPGGKQVPPYKYVRGVVEQYTSPFEVKKVETLVANFGHRAKHQVVDKLVDMVPAAIILGITLGYTQYVNDKKYKESLF
eukprot:CAMPEP_0113678686 /NCGR_PEP_ID=MMETSP0038_2-20120614/10115_1 /TAXON_ID=2898 /ORGANISM="Cryptomonas paramecium" /LENGTH=101 /DNA_ID=CAMNT_0000596411 /DNA_START=279 /DNA_END=584 /DNA_ORIENTATION=+ /assembly_acc=CAM_ASM_000170